MKMNTKSSITLPAEELKLVESLKTKLHAKTKVEVIRRGLLLLKESTERKELKLQYEKASEAVQKYAAKELSDLDHLSGEGLEE